MYAKTRTCKRCLYARELMVQVVRSAAHIAANASYSCKSCKLSCNDGLQVDIDKAIVIEENCLAAV